MPSSMTLLPKKRASESKMPRRSYSHLVRDGNAAMFGSEHCLADAQPVELPARMQLTVYMHLWLASLTRRGRVLRSPDIRGGVRRRRFSNRHGRWRLVRSVVVQQKEMANASPHRQQYHHRNIPRSVH